MFGEPPVEEREFGIDQISCREILVDQLSKELSSFLQHRLTQYVIVLREKFLIGSRRVDILEPQPLIQKIVQEAIGLLIVEHSIHLTRQNVRFVQLVFRSEAEQLIVRQTLPEKVGKPCRQCVTLEFAGIACVKQELG